MRANDLMRACFNQHYLYFSRDMHNWIAGDCGGLWGISGNAMNIELQRGMANNR
jgi:hypothetical protein